MPIIPIGAAMASIGGTAASAAGGAAGAAAGGIGAKVAAGAVGKGFMGSMLGKGGWAKFGLDVLGSVGGVLGIIGFHRHPMVESDPTHSTVRIATGLNFEGGLSGAGGQVPLISLFAENGQSLGTWKGKGKWKVDDGSFMEVKVRHRKESTKQSTYMTLSGRNDAICIAYITNTWPDDSKYAWTGDWAQLCEPYSEDPLPWYYSNIYIDNENYSPHCMWIGNDNKTYPTGLQLHFMDFLAVESEHGNMTAEQKTALTKELCTNGYSFVAHREPDYKKLHLGYAKGVVGTHNRTKTIEPRDEPGMATNLGFADKLVRDNGTVHSARSLCDSRSSLGPDFVNIGEGLFCDMDTHELWPVCREGGEDKCFNVGSNQLIVGGKASRKTYSQLLDWTRP
ncbi:hypothetical protein HJFPF1_12447 [Paramyrothecium foliicola]|nr:hypothetical protein HJFPF1_12447 [Paramyrothecium foliicola]